MPKEIEVLACQFQEWYPTFKGFSIASEIVPLSEEFVDYLLQDGIFLPENSDAMPRRSKNVEWAAHSESYEPWDESEDTDEEPQVPTFTELEIAVNEAIARLGGSVVPKLNWSCPKDVGWLSSSGSAKCHNAGEVFLLLKSSDTISHDLCESFQVCETASLTRPPKFFLGLRRYFPLQPAMEFRCFVLCHKLVGICQRDVTSHFPELSDLQNEIEILIHDFYNENVHSKFSLDTYTMDVYITKKRNVKIIDFNTWGGTTLPLLFSWDEFQVADGYEAISKITRSKVHDAEAISSLSSLRGQGDNFTNHFESSSIEECDSSNISTDDVDYQYHPSAEGKCEQNSIVGSGPHFRIVNSSEGVKPSLRSLAGVPLDLYDLAPGSAIDEFLKQTEKII